MLEGEGSGRNTIPHYLQLMSSGAGMASGNVNMPPQPSTNGSFASFSEHAVFAPARLAPFQTNAVTPYGLHQIPMTLNASQTHVTNVSFAEGAHLVALPADKDLSPEKCKLRTQIHQPESYICHVEHHCENTIVSNRNNLELQAHAALRSQEGRFEFVAARAIAEAKDVVKLEEVQMSIDFDRQTSQSQQEQSHTRSRQ